MSYLTKHGENTASDNKNRKKILIPAAVILAAVVIVVLILVIRSATTPYGHRHDVQVLPGGGENVSEVTGLWKVDDITSLEFDGSGRGVMHTSADREFAYSAQDGELRMDFDYDGVDDAAFTYSINGGTMRMERNGQIYEMTKQ